MELAAALGGQWVDLSNCRGCSVLAMTLMEWPLGNYLADLGRELSG